MNVLVPVAELAAVFAEGTNRSRALAPRILKSAIWLAWVASVLAVGLAVWVAAESVGKLVDGDEKAGFEDALNIVGAVGVVSATGGWMFLEVVGHASPLAGGGSWRAGRSCPSPC